MAFIHNLLLILERGIGEVMFQNNAFSGLLMLIGIFLNSWQMGTLAVCGNIISILTAYFSGYKYDDIKNGLYRFNGTLAGITVGVFLQLSVEGLIMLIIASALSTWIAYFFLSATFNFWLYSSFHSCCMGNVGSLQLAYTRFTISFRYGY